MEIALKVEVRKYPYHGDPKEYTVWIVNGYQSFHLDYVGDEEECEWYAKQLRHALNIS